MCSYLIVILYFVTKLFVKDSVTRAVKWLVGAYLLVLNGISASLYRYLVKHVGSLNPAKNYATVAFSPISSVAVIPEIQWQFTQHFSGSSPSTSVAVHPALQWHFTQKFSGTLTSISSAVPPAVQ